MDLSYLLAAISLTGLFIVPRKPRLAWFVLMITEVGWIVWCTYIKQGALALLAVFYFALYLSNLYRSTNKKEGEL